MDVTALSVAAIGAASGSWAVIQSRMASRDRRREKQSPRSQERQAQVDERAANKAAYDRLTGENARLDKALEDAYTDLDATQHRLRDLRTEYDILQKDRDKCRQEADGALMANTVLQTKLDRLAVHATSLEATVLHVATDHAPPIDDDSVGP